MDDEDFKKRLREEEDFMEKSRVRPVRHISGSASMGNTIHINIDVKALMKEMEKLFEDMEEDVEDEQGFYFEEEPKKNKFDFKFHRGKNKKKK
jgi:hypothetical protein